MDEACSLFRQGVTSVFKQWMVLHLAVTNNWGGGDSYRKATLLLEETLRLFVPPPLARTAHRPKKLPTPEELEEKLGDYMEEQFGTLVEDGSLEEVSAWVCNLWEECKEGRREGVTKVRPPC
ncbi:dt1p1a10l protein [Nannochloropsis gaditana CCMP526]|uniref:dt1p1a10l protein n=1 Tax=Nannochloropsis gaditana (strain CCMP526) TaxID=1093141 RepID=UPI00029F55B0|nr:dt1p1a10l protein [Nannochloropsis gaditana CCMP526]EKU21292.1 dt1p1a10l protein [Nannochloropsis gaditana CCMP526]|eukprot:XP_005855069.1 dt1p1a10l protein [Nannochloropsis gaditana CCMP526]